ncbi:MAG: LLM class flavin-dependent oxidoreductase [Actinomycetota bacterium]|nr:LLM class flavin-dependent oxidoreductase [Actinomycetota bacterium]
MAGRKGNALKRVGRLADVWLPYMVSPAMVADGLGRVHASAAEHGRPPGAVAGAVFAWTCTDADGDWARRTSIDMVSSTYQQDDERRRVVDTIAEDVLPALSKL